MLETALAQFTLIDLGQWLMKALEAARTRRAKKAARLLHRAAILVRCCRTLDTAFRGLFLEIDKLEKDWPADRRDKLTTQVQELAHQETILDELQLSIGYLSEELRENTLIDLWRGESRADVVVQNLLDFGRSVRDLLGETDSTPWSTPAEFTDLLNGIKHADNDQWVKATIDGAKRTLEVLDRAAIRGGRANLGKLEQILIEKYGLPGLSDDATASKS